MDGDYLKGLNWNGADRFVIEASMIRDGGYTTINGIRYGHGLVYHYKKAISALLPYFDWNKWSTLLIENFVMKDEIGVMGPASSGKTYCAAAFAYCVFQIWPKGTSIIMSSTTREGLQLRVWGALKEIHSKAKSRRKWLSGRIIESRYMLTGADLNDEAQDFRDGIIGVPTRIGGEFVGISNYCFTAGAMVLTINGEIPIQNVKVGDVVISAIGPRKVTETFKHESESLVRLHLSNGRSIDCTPNHRFFTSLGWLSAVDIPKNTALFSPHETSQIMQNMWKTAPETSEEILQQTVQDESVGETVQTMRKGVHRMRKQSDFLQQSLLWEMDHVRSRSGSEDCGKEGLGRDWKENKSVHNGEQGGKAFEGKKVPKNDNHKRQLQQLQRIGTNKRRSYGFENVPRFDMELRGKNRGFIKNGNDSSVSNRCSFSGNTARSGTRRRQPQIDSTARFETGRLVESTRLDNIEILKPKSEVQTGICKRTHTVYNLSVEGHPSYTVNGVVVHNCGLKNDRIILVADEASLMNRGFYDSISNLRKNPSFKLIAMGNPKDRTDALGLICEPNIKIGGWDGQDYAETTRTWPTRALNGVAIQLCGLDSPNYDYPRGLNPHIGLITPEHIENDLAYYGRDSMQFSMMNLGVMPKDGGSRRVVTMAMCERNQAFEQPTWSASPLTRVLALDAAYRGVGGDRCVMTDLSFGLDVTGKTLLAQNGSQLIVPITAKDPREAEEQIVRWVMDYAIKHGVLPENVGFDSTGRGTLMSAFARIWSPEVVAIEFGGSPTDRKVRADSTKTEAQEYGKMVTALWYSSRLVVESSQMRGISRECALEGASREWGVNKNGKVDVEPKDKTKLRMGRSPDLWDSLVTGVEIARRRGFQIAAGTGVGVAKRSTLKWMLDRQKQTRQFEKRHDLQAV